MSPVQVADELWVNPDHVESCSGKGQACTLHMSSGVQWMVAVTAARVVSFLTHAEVYQADDVVLEEAEA